MKDTTRKRKKARRGCEAADGRHELIDQMDHLCVRGTQGCDAGMKERGRMMAETIMSIEREDIAGPDSRPLSSDIQTGASQGGSMSLGNHLPAGRQGRSRRSTRGDGGQRARSRSGLLIDLCIHNGNS